VSEYRNLVENLTLDRRGRRRRSLRRMWSLEQLPMPRAFFTGPKWKRLCEVREVPIAEIHPQAAELHRPGRKLLIFSFEDEVRERVLERLGHDVFACWSDPREQLGLQEA
jgi:hypothetical protein